MLCWAFGCGSEEGAVVWLSSTDGSVNRAIDRAQSSTPRSCKTRRDHFGQSANTAPSSKRWIWSGLKPRTEPPRTLEGSSPAQVTAGRDGKYIKVF